MTNQANQQRIQNIYQMLFEMATGNFTFRIAEDEYDRELKELSKMLNEIAENMLHVIQRSGFVCPKYTYQGLVQFTFILNPDFKIQSLSPDAAKQLGYLPQFLFNINFSEVIDVKSFELLQHIMPDSKTKTNYQEIYQLVFKTATSKVVPAFCTISNLHYSDNIFISAISTKLLDYIPDNYSTASTTRPDDSEIIQQLHNYIMNHLDKPLPTLKQLAMAFGTNEFKLKDGFKYFFNSSIYHFYNEERLKKAHQLIQQSSHSIKAIAFMSGFNDYITFYKAFKKRFGYSPRELVREHDGEADE